MANPLGLFIKTVVTYAVYVGLQIGVHFKTTLNIGTRDTNLDTVLNVSYVMITL